MFARLVQLVYSVSNPLFVRQASSSTGTPSSVVAAAADTALLAANTARLGATIYNDSTATLYLVAGSGAASTTNYTIQIAPNGYYELPYNYTGAVRGIWTAANGNARITEYT